MTLNASGPISLGGSTTGQSINLELGQSATATASINATNFRTLANVASGQISLSNFYGKSNSFGWISYISGTGALQSSSSFFVDASGNSYFGYRGGVGYPTNAATAKLNTSGSTVTYSWPYGGQPTNIIAASSIYTGDANFFTCSDISSFGGPWSTLNSSLGYQSGKKTGGNIQYPTNTAMTPDGRVYILGRYVGKSEDAKIISISSSGVNTGGWMSTQGASSQYSAIAPVSDNGVVWVFKYGSVISWDRLPAGGGSAGIVGYKASYAWTDGGNQFNQAATDSSNNVYAVANTGYLIKITSSNTISGRGTSTSEMDAAVAVYGSFVYVLTTNSGYNGCNLYCYDTATLTPQWKNTFTFSNGNCTNSRGRLFANSTGIYTILNNNVWGNFIMKIPLTGFPSTSSKSLNAPSGATFSWVKTTFSATSLAFNSPTANQYMYQSVPFYSNSSAYPASSTSAPANTNTPI